MTQKMKKTKTHPLAIAYIEEICSKVKAKDIRPDIQDELLNHLEELIEARLSDEPDEDPDTATRWAIRQMGEPAEVAAGLNRVHKPRIPWAMLGALGFLLIIALFVMDALTRAYASSEHPISQYSLLQQHIWNITLGLAVMFVISRIPYRRLLPYAGWLYVGIIALMGFASIWGAEINGQTMYIFIGGMTFNIYEISIYVFMVLSAVALSRSETNSWRDALRHFLLFTVVPIILYLFVPSSSMLILYGSANMILLLVYRRDWRWWIPQAGLLLIISGYLILVSDYVQRRVSAFFQPDSMDGYLYRQIGEAIRTSSWQGRGVESLVDRLPFLHAESVLTFIIHSLGWSFGLLVLATVFLLLLQLTRAARLVRDTPGKMIISAIAILLTMHYIWSFAMTLGWLPVLSISTPFISYGGSATLAQSAAIGLIYAIYRRKDMVRFSS